MEFTGWWRYTAERFVCLSRPSTLRSRSLSPGGAGSQPAGLCSRTRPRGAPGAAAVRSSGSDSFLGQSRLPFSQLTLCSSIPVRERERERLTLKDSYNGARAETPPPAEGELEGKGGSHIHHHWAQVGMEPHVRCSAFLRVTRKDVSKNVNSCSKKVFYFCRSQ